MKNLSPEEAIAILNDMKIDIPVPKAAVTQKRRNVALDMAISAMSCSEIPNSSDTISRKAAIEALYSQREKSGNIWVRTAITNCVEAIEQLPPAEPQIIMCQHCKEFDENHHYCTLHDMEMSLTDFCSYAERKTDEE